MCVPKNHRLNIEEKYSKPPPRSLTGSSRTNLRIKHCRNVRTAGAGWVELAPKEPISIALEGWQCGGSSAWRRNWMGAPSSVKYAENQTSNPFPPISYHIYIIIHDYTYHILIEYPPRNPGLAEVSELNILFLGRPWKVPLHSFTFLCIFCIFARLHGQEEHCIIPSQNGAKQSLNSGLVIIGSYWIYIFIFSPLVQGYSILGVCTQYYITFNIWLDLSIGLFFGVTHFSHEVYGHLVGAPESKGFFPLNYTATRAQLWPSIVAVGVRHERRYSSGCVGKCGMAAKSPFL